MYRQIPKEYIELYTLTISKNPPHIELHTKDSLKVLNITSNKILFPFDVQGDKIYQIYKGKNIYEKNLLKCDVEKFLEIMNDVSLSIEAYEIMNNIKTLKEEMGFN